MKIHGLAKLTVKTFCAGLVALSLPFFAWSQPSANVTITDLGNYLEMKNGYLGVRLAKGSLFDPSLPDYVPGPIQNVIYKDGTPGNNYPVYLRSTVPPQSMSDTILYQTPDSCAIRISYAFNKPVFYGNSGEFLEPAGPGYYRVTFRMFKGEKACVVTEEGDFEVNYEMRVSNGLSPDRGRYQGHFATSAQDGYDINGDRYERGYNTGWNATVDLQFQQRKDFPPLARWNPWVFNSGWHWQLYNQSAPANANVFGIFDGRPSKLLGAKGSGVNVFTGAAGMEDLHAACLNNVCHYVWESSGKLYYKKIEANGSSATEVVLADSLIRPFVFVHGNVVNVLAINPFAPAGSKAKLLKKTGSGPFVKHTLSLDASLEDPFLYGASNGTKDFLLIEGTRTNAGTPVHGLHLYAANFNTTSFTWKDVLPTAEVWRAANRPDMKAVPGGSVVVTYGFGGNYLRFDRIRADSTRFMHPPQFSYANVMFSSCVDPSTGDFFHTNTSGNIVYVDLSDTSVVASHATNLGIGMNNFVQHLPNRRSMATDAAGNALVSNDWDYYWFQKSTKTWTKLNHAVWGALYPSHIHYNTVTDSFYVVGKYQGKLCRFRTKDGTNPVLVSQFNSTAQPVAGIRVELSRIFPPAYFPDIRFEWAIFAGEKGSDLPAANVVQPIGLTMNRLSGMANKVDNYQGTPLVFNNSFLTGSLYKSSASMSALINKIRTDNSFYEEMIHIDPYFKNIMDAWRDDPGNPVNTGLAYQEIVNYATNLKSALKTGDGIYSYQHHYTLGSNEMQRLAIKTAGLLADNKLSAAQRNDLQGIAALFARILWDDDFVPFYLDHGLSFGTGSQGNTYALRRWFFCLLANTTPEFSTRASAVSDFLQTAINEYVNAHGAAKGTPHYLQPTMDQLAMIALQLRNAGIVNKFSSSDTLKYFADFLLYLKTPASVRFNNHRKLISLGDGSEESAAIFALMATGFADVDTLLSRKLMHAYRNGRATGTDFGFVTMAVNQELPDTNLFDAKTGHFPGYMSTMRSGVGTNNESALWFLNGDWFSDHRNDDRGQAVIYALGAPLSLNFGSFYTPHMISPHLKNSLAPESLFPQWNGASQPFILSSEVWNGSSNQAYQAYKNSSYSKALINGLSENWTRQVHFFSPRVQNPIFIIKDSLNTSSNFIWNFNFMAEGPVQTPSGTVDPPNAFWNGQGSPQEQPSASPLINLGTGLNRFDFQGSNWVTHPSSGIDWEVYVQTQNPGGATLSEMGHNFIPTNELNDFTVNNGSSFAENQTLLRIKGTNSFYTVIVPYPKGQRPTDLSITKTGNTLFINAPGLFSFNTDLASAKYTEPGGRKVLTAFDSQSYSLGGATVAGGPMELEMLADTIYARLHGPGGVRTVTLPAGNWTLKGRSSSGYFSNGQWLLNHSFQDSLHNTYTGGYTEYIFTRALKLSAKVLLQGPYSTSTSLMSDQLRQDGLLPLSEPYSGLNFAHIAGGGNEQTWQAVLDAAGSNAIVDWVLLELRDKNNPATVLATRCALLQRDGDVVDVDGNSTVDFHQSQPDNYFVVIRHRNHLSACTAQSLAFNLTGATSVDFTATSTSTWGTNARASLGSGKWGLWSGNGNGDNKIVYAGSGTDVTPVSSKVLLDPANGSFSPNFPKPGYERADYNMDGKVIYTGTDSDVSKVSSSVLMHPGNPASSPTRPVIDQLPN
ncbi:MAG: hypothetical protein RI973_262 [Bacteroidota bacterium]|jgi:hypothetical protein